MTRSLRGPAAPSARCQHCSWTYIGTGHPEVTAAFYDHLRDHHHRQWVRA